LHPHTQSLGHLCGRPYCDWRHHGSVFELLDSQGPQRANPAQIQVGVCLPRPDRHHHPKETTPEAQGEGERQERGRTPVSVPCHSQYSLARG